MTDTQNTEENKFHNIIEQGKKLKQHKLELRAASLKAKEKLANEKTERIKDKVFGIVNSHIN